MTPEQAIERLDWHTQPEPDAFLGMLRPYSGTLRLEVLGDLEEAVRGALPALSQPVLSRRLVSSLWAIVHYGRMWALEPDGMLRRNNLISDHDLGTLERFLTGLSFGLALILGDAVDEGIRELGEYRARR